MYNITFKENRKYELVVDFKTVAIFYGRETKEVDDEIVESKDFESDRNYFIVEKVEKKPLKPLIERKEKKE